MELMDGVMEYIRPELLVLVAVLYIVGKALKASQDVKDKHIPLILGGAGVFLAMLWVVATGNSTYRHCAGPVYRYRAEGRMVAGLAYTPISSSTGGPGGLSPNAKRASPAHGYPAPGMLFVF